MLIINDYENLLTIFMLKKVDHQLIFRPFP